MTARQELWAVVLAAGDGLRLAELPLGPLPGGNVIVQPSNRGTANGVLLSVLSILQRDPQACMLFLPADHHVCDEPKLALAMREAIRTLASDAGTLALVGIEPDEADPGLGYIVPGRTLPDGSRTVEEFVEKPELSRARELIAAGALWNSLIFSANGAALLERVRASMGWIVSEMAAALARDARVGWATAALTGLYGALPCVDFSRTILQGAAASLRVITAPHCGWCDLGTPRRVAGLLKRLQAGSLPLRAGDSALAGFRPITRSSNSTTQTTHLGP